MRPILPLLLLLLLLTISAGVLSARTARADDEPAKQVLVVGTKDAPPFSMRDAGGRWYGISIELAERIAKELGRQIEYRETTLDGLLDGVRDGTLDAAVAALTITAEREETIDFTHAFHTSGLGIAVPATHESGWGMILGRVLSSAFLKAVFALVIVLSAVGFALWLFERKHNAAQFGGKPAQGLGNAFWWSAVTMTTVGYGDKAPVTWAGRLVALIWMFASIILIAGFTGSIASALTVSRLEGTIHGPEDLPGLTVGTVPDSTSERYLRARGIARRGYPDVQAALEALAAGRVEAVVYDAPLLVYRVAQDDRFAGRLTVLPQVFERQDYAIALPPGAEDREALNRILLKIINGEDWQDVLDRYLVR
jgi:ABC-type amino acid transport substrate-binding protein